MLASWLDCRSVCHDFSKGQGSYTSNAAAPKGGTYLTWYGVLVAVGALLPRHVPVQLQHGVLDLLKLAVHILRAKWKLDHNYGVPKFPPPPEVLEQLLFFVGGFSFLPRIL